MRRACSEGGEEVDIWVFVENCEFGHGRRCGKLRGTAVLMLGRGVPSMGGAGRSVDGTKVGVSQVQSATSSYRANQNKGYQDENCKISV